MSRLHIGTAFVATAFAMAAPAGASPTWSASIPKAPDGPQPSPPTDYLCSAPIRRTPGKSRA